MTGLLLIAPILSLLVLAAHFFRAGSYVLVALVLLAAGFLFVRRPWTARVVQILLILGSIEWVRTALHLKLERESTGEPATRMLIILGVVTAVTLFSALLFETRRLKAAYRVMVAVLVLSLAVPPTVRAENCFDLASRKLNPRSRITLHLTDGSAVNGRLEFLDTREKVLLLTAAGEEKREPRTYAMSSIASLDYREHSSDALWPVAGAFGGALAGAGIATLATLGSDCESGGLNPEPCPRGLVILASAVIGGLSGLFLGFIIPPTVSRDASITCAD